MRLILDMPPMSFNGFPHQGVPRISPSAAAASKPTPGPRAVTWLKRQKFGRKGINCGFLPWVNWQSSAFGHSRVPNLSVSPFLRFSSVFMSVPPLPMARLQDAQGPVAHISSRKYPSLSTIGCCPVSVRHILEKATPAKLGLSGWQLSTLAMEVCPTFSLSKYLPNSSHQGILI